MWCHQEFESGKIIAGIQCEGECQRCRCGWAKGSDGSGIGCDFAEVGADGLPIYLGAVGVGGDLEVDFGGSLGVGCRCGNGRSGLGDRKAAQDRRKAVGASEGVGQDNGDGVEGVQFGAEEQEFGGGGEGVLVEVPLPLNGAACGGFQHQALALAIVGVGRDGEPRSEGLRQDGELLGCGFRAGAGSGVLDKIGSALEAHVGINFAGLVVGEGDAGGGFPEKSAGKGNGRGNWVGPAFAVCGIGIGETGVVGLVDP